MLLEPYNKTFLTFFFSDKVSKDLIKISKWLQNHGMEEFVNVYSSIRSSVLTRSIQKYIFCLFCFNPFSFILYDYHLFFPNFRDLVILQIYFKKKTLQISRAFNFFP